MRLLKVKLSGVRRFHSSNALLVADRLVAIVGPNEAGKTTILSALDQIDRLNDPLPASMATRQTSDLPEIRALFELDGPDIDAIAEVAGQAVKRLWVIRSTTGTSWRLEPSPLRDRSQRAKALEALQAVASAVSDDHAVLDGPFQEALETLKSTKDSLEDEQIETLRSVGASLRSSAENDSDEDTETDTESVSIAEVCGHAIDVLDAAVEHEATQSPWRQSVQILRQRIPRIAEFADEDRDLRGEYDLQELIDDVPSALGNVADLADLDVLGLRDAIAAGDHGSVRLARERANETLRVFFETNYTQSDVSLQLDTDGSLLRLLVNAEGGEDVIELSERSSGFRWFVALVAFLAQRRFENPIVLIDEIETHLHYAAQADVVDVLSRQRVAPQVIYTTHSAGALPPDLGRGVRAVVPVVGRQRSEINNSFWTSGPGFTPLLFGLGASTLAFTIPRRVVIAEGASDAILLPTLIREAAEQAELEYRIAPGIANTSAASFDKLDEEGGRVAYLVDGDTQGATYVDELVGAGIARTRIVSLADAAAEDATPEDCVDVSLYVESLNLEGAAFWGAERIDAADLPSTGRAKAVDDWCHAKSLPNVSKVRVAQRLLESAWTGEGEAEEATTSSDSTESGWRERNLCDERGAVWIRAVHQAIEDALAAQ